MNNAAVHSALGKLKMEHRNFGLMIDELDAAVSSFEGEMLCNAIDDITKRYNFPVI